MGDIDKQGEWLHWEEAKEFLDSIDDQTTKRLMHLAHFPVLKRMMRKESPSASFDVRFYLEIVHEFCSDQESIRRVLAGEDLSWFGADESD